MRSPRPTHAGAVVFRERSGGAEFLLVTATDTASEWVLPKGHIETAETAIDAAMREVAEEAGVAAEPLEGLGEVEFRRGDALVRVAFFLARETGAAAPGKESRRVAWLPIETAVRTASHAESRDMLRRAAARLRHGGTA